MDVEGARAKWSLWMSAIGLQQPNLPLGDWKSGFDGDKDVEEDGHWHYMVVDPAGLRPRSGPAYDKCTKEGPRLLEGEVLAVTRRTARSSGARFLKLADGGWAFDRQPSCSSKADGRMRMVEVAVEVGLWAYSVRVRRGIAARRRPTFAHSADSARGPEMGETFTVTRRVTCGPTTFLKLEDGRGWVFDKKHGMQMTEGPLWGHGAEAQGDPGFTAAASAEEETFCTDVPSGRGGRRYFPLKTGKADRDEVPSHDDEDANPGRGFKIPHWKTTLKTESSSYAVMQDQD